MRRELGEKSDRRGAGERKVRRFLRHRSECRKQPEWESTSLGCRRNEGSRHRYLVSRIERSEESSSIHVTNFPLLSLSPPLIRYPLLMSSFFFPLKTKIIAFSFSLFSSEHLRPEYLRLRRHPVRGGDLSGRDTEGEREALALAS